MFQWLSKQKPGCGKFHFPVGRSFQTASKIETMLGKIFENFPQIEKISEVASPPCTMFGQRCIFASSAHFYNFFNIEGGGGGGFFSKYFFQGCLKHFLYSNNVCMYFGSRKIALVDLWKLNNRYNEAIMIFTTSI